MRTLFRFHAAVAALVALGPVGCERKAPSPEECHATALRWVGSELGSAGIRRSLAETRALEQRVLERARACLVIPFDREMVACVASRPSASSCLRQFEARRAENL